MVPCCDWSKKVCLLFFFFLKQAAAHRKNSFSHRLISNPALSVFEMTQYLPPNLLALFAARPPIPYLPPPDLKKKKLPAYQGVAHLLSEFEDPSTVDYSKFSVGGMDTKEGRKKRKREEKINKHKEVIVKELEQCTYQRLFCF